MVNIPSSVQTTWDKVAQDKKISKADVAELKTAASVDGISKEEETFIATIENATKDGNELSVKEGSSKGTFDFVDDTPVVAKASPSTETSQKIKDLETLKAKLPASFSGKELETQVAIIDKKIAELKGEAPAVVKPTGEVKPAKEESKPDLVGEKIKNLEALKAKLPASFSGKDLETQVAVIDKKIEALKKEHFTNTATDIIDNASKRDLATLNGNKQSLNSEYDGLPQAAQDDKGVKDIKDKANAEIYNNSKKELFNEINKVIDTAVQDALKTGDMNKFTEAKAKISGMMEQYKGLDDDPTFKKIKAILKGAPEANDIQISADNKVMAAANLIESGNKIIESPTVGRREYNKGQEIIPKLPEGEFRTKLENKINGFKETQGKLHEENKPQSLDSLHQILKRNIFSSSSKDTSSEAVLQLIARQKDLDGLLRKLNPQEQERIVNIMAKSSDPFSNDIAKKVYNNLSKVADVDSRFEKAVLDKVKPKDENGYKEADFSKASVNPENYAKSLSYALRNEKDTALTLARGIAEGNVSESVLSKLSKSDVSNLLDLLGKDGRPGEKDDMLSLIGQTATPINIGNLDRGSKASMLKQYMENDKFDEKTLPTFLKNYDKKDIFASVKSLDDKQIALLAKHSNGDTMSDDVGNGVKMATSMIKVYNKEPKGNISISDINKFLDGIEKDADKSKIAAQIIDSLGDGPDSDYSKIKQLSPRLMDRLWQMKDSTY